VTNAIEVYVQDRTSCASFNDGAGVIGIQNNARTEGYAPEGRNGGTWEAHEEAWRFVPDGEPNYEFVWLDEDGAEISTDEEIEVGVGCYTALVTYENCNGETVEAESTVCVTQEEGAEIDPTDLEDILLCDDENTGEAEFDLTVNGLNLLADGEDPDEYEVFYYANDDDYLNDDPIENPEAYTNVENPQTITLDIRKPGIECDFPLEFDIGVFSAGEAFTPGDICTDEELIDLTLQDADILQDQDSDEYGVTY